jgi:hypothetical protein
MKKKVFEIVVKSETSADFQARGSSGAFQDVADVNLDEDIDEALTDAGYSRDDIKKAVVMAGYYGTIVNNNSHDWTVGGSVNVARGIAGTPVQAMTYTTESIDGLIGAKKKAVLNQAAVDLVNTAINDYLAGQNGIVLRFTLDNATMAPSPSVGDPVNFDWRAWIAIQVILSDEADWPDPF